MVKGRGGDFKAAAVGLTGAKNVAGRARIVWPREQSVWFSVRDWAW